jgi:uncharacterized Zn-binding protein involved in type VI secretion
MVVLMGSPGAKRGDSVVGLDLHLVIVPPSTVPTSMTLPFGGELSSDLGAHVFIDNRAAATQGSRAVARPPHVAPGTIVRPPSNDGVVRSGSGSVFIEGRQAARDGDPVDTCTDLPSGAASRIVATGRVFIGG